MGLLAAPTTWMSLSRQRHSFSTGPRAGKKNQDPRRRAAGAYASLGMAVGRLWALAVALAILQCIGGVSSSLPLCRPPCGVNIFVTVCGGRAGSSPGRLVLVALSAAAVLPRNLPAPASR